MHADSDDFIKHLSFMHADSDETDEYSCDTSFLQSSDCLEMYVYVWCITVIM